MKQKNKIMISLSIFVILGLGVISGCQNIGTELPDVNLNIKNEGNLKSFASCSALKSELKGAYTNREEVYSTAGDSLSAVAKASSAESAGVDYSGTNIQVEGVDEADIVKTDGKYIYMVSGNKFVIARAYPEESAEILSEFELKKFTPNELFVDEDRILIFGTSYYEDRNLYPNAGGDALRSRFIPYSGITSIKIFDASDKSNPEIIREADFEGNYITSRKIDSWVYFVINSYPRFYDYNEITPMNMLPRFREGSEEFTPSVDCTNVKYFEPIRPESFVTVAGINIQSDEDIEKEVILGSGQNAYASLGNLYIAETDYGYGYNGYPEIDRAIPREKTRIYKFGLDNGNIAYLGNGVAPGTILNQFSMDEYKDYFRIATTTGNVWDENQKSKNNVYVFDDDLDLIGSLEDLAPGERIYSTRFMGNRAYMVTFKKIDPLFVIDLSNPKNPEVLGKLKIPGFSDYLHPYDEDHIIGVGKDTAEAGIDEKERRELDFAWYQGLKLAIFDVSDVENPKQLHVELIGDRGTDSEALSNHKAFLFDKERKLLVIPVTLAEIDREKYSDEVPANEYGEFIFQGAYVYDIDLTNGFDLKGRITHYDDEEIYKKSGYYFYDGNYHVTRSLYIGDVLYTISRGKIKLSYLKDLDEIKELRIKVTETQDYPLYY